MRRIVRQFRLVVFIGYAALWLTACGRSPSRADSQPQSIVRGDPIVPAPSPTRQAKPDASVSATAAAPAAMPPIRPSQPLAETLRLADDYITVGFDQLASYNFEIDDAPYTNQPAADKANDQIPARVKAFDQKKVSIKGFMLPLKVAAGEVTEFLIMKDQSLCCYGSVPKITEWVSVKTSGHGVKPIMDQPVSILGTLHVGAIRENGYLIGIYQMDGDKLVPPEN
jgi:hypothetical protein